MGACEECLKNKELAAKTLPPLIESEFYKGNEQPTEKKVLEILKRDLNREWKIEELCLELRLLPSTIRSLRILEKSNLVKN